MPVRIKCPQCENVVSVPDNARDKQVRCGMCQALMTVPGECASGDKRNAPARSRSEGVTEEPSRRPRNDDREEERGAREDRRRQREMRADRPLRQLREDEDWDDAGPHRRRRPGNSVQPLIFAVVGGAVVVLGLLLGLVVVLAHTNPPPRPLPRVVQIPAPQAPFPPMPQPPADIAQMQPPPIQFPGIPPIALPPMAQEPNGLPPAVQAPADVAPGVSGAVRYQLKPGAAYHYTLTLTANRPDGVETTNTTIELRVNSATGSEFELMLGVSPLAQRFQSKTPFGLPPLFQPPMIEFPGFFGPRLLTINSAGDVVRTSGQDTQLPYLLGSAAQFVIERLAERGEASWQRSNDLTIREINKLFSFRTLWPAQQS